VELISKICIQVCKSTYIRNSLSPESLDNINAAREGFVELIENFVVIFKTE